jgi:hypothetical protein
MMKVFKPTVIILLASTLVILIALPIDQTEWTEWADGLRETVSSHGDQESPSTGFRYVLPFVKEFVLMGTQGRLLLAILRINKSIKQKKKLDNTDFPLPLFNLQFIP